MPCTPGMVSCHRGCRHRLMVMEYRAARLAGELAKDIATGGTTEEADAFPIITFHDWLIQTRNPDHR